MARLTSLAVIFSVVLLLTANAYAIRTIISTVEIDEATNPNHHQPSCQKIPSVYLDNCRRYITGSSILLPYDWLCCQEMRSLDDECQCRAMELLIQEVRSSEVEQWLDMKHIIKRAEAVSVFCELKQRYQDVNPVDHDWVVEALGLKDEIRSETPIRELHGSEERDRGGRWQKRAEEEWGCSVGVRRGEDVRVVDYLDNRNFKKRGSLDKGKQCSVRNSKRKPSFPRCQNGKLVLSKQKPATGRDDSWTSIS
ncbi:hypothetical protein LWI29_028605 [Acer saccharum]|uniref:Bifunctional inhibitor/plant lipid transfer protein/seed storage helical domain-containing protein n=1 Tax=Acer saccharum TaxID=4024 RepID=A0AA39W2N2_ACESA|nr:hypothetical protein LWI29_028605 [Acer saccharum]